MLTVYDTKEIMDILHLKTPGIIYNLFETGELVGFKNYKQKWLCYESDLIDYIEKQKQKTEQKIESKSNNLFRVI